MKVEHNNVADIIIVVRKQQTNIIFVAFRFCDDVSNVVPRPESEVCYLDYCYTLDEHPFPKAHEDQ